MMIKTVWAGGIGCDLLKVVRVGFVRKVMFQESERKLREKEGTEILIWNSYGRAPGRRHLREPG